MSRNIFDLDAYNNATDQDAKDWVEEQLPEKHYGKDILIYEGCDLRLLLEQAYMAGKERDELELQGARSTLFREYIEVLKERDELKRKLETQTHNMNVLNNEIITLEQKLDVAVEALEFYAKKESWSINEDYDGYVNEGWIAAEDIEYPPKIPNTFSGYGYGGIKAREALKKIKPDGREEK